MPLLVFILPCVTDWVCVWSRTILFHMSGRAYIYNLIQTFFSGCVDELMKSFSTLEVYLVRVCSAGLQSNVPWQPVMLGINGPQQNRRAHSTSVVVTERENMCVCEREGLYATERCGNGKKGQKTAWKEQYRYYWIKSGNGSRLSHNISISKRWNICECFSALLTLQNWV